MDERRSGYKQFLDSAAGKDFIQWLLNKEIAAQMEGSQSDTVEGKALAMVKLNNTYDVRSYVSNMSKPAPTPSVRSKTKKSAAS